MLGLVVFLAAYVALAGWFAWAAWRMARADGSLLMWVAAAGLGFLAVFMIKAFVFIRRGGTDDAHELTRAEHPRLFGFLDRLADDAHAPRPHRVFLRDPPAQALAVPKRSTPSSRRLKRSVITSSR